KNTYNDKISMNKAFEYMTLGIPFVQFDLMEGRKIAGEAALYAADNSPIDLARQLARLMDEPALAQSLAQEGRARAKALLKWDDEASRLLSAYDLALGAKRKPHAVPHGREVAAAGN
ncbi:MAG: glycosyltransferase, partial [Hyphomicrobiaceae bacterium]